MRLLFLKPLSNSLTPSHEFLYTTANTALLTRDEGFGGEVVNAGIKAVGYEVGEHAHEFLHLLPFHA